MHTDAAQALGKRRVDVEDLGVDFLTIVGHKVCMQGPPALLLDTAEWNPQPRCPFLLKSLLSSSELRVLRSRDNHSGRVLSSELSVHVWDRTSNSWDDAWQARTQVAGHPNHKEPREDIVDSVEDWKTVGLVHRECWLQGPHLPMWRSPPAWKRWVQETVTSLVKL